MDKVNAWPAQSTTTLAGTPALFFINVMEFNIQHVLFVGVEGGYVMTQHEGTFIYYIRCTKKPIRPNSI
jgi:hypothetical protein